MDRPIIFSAPMVLALLAGRKTQTRRLATSPLRRCEVGDRLYVREAWRMPDTFDADSPSSADMRTTPGFHPNVFYEADGTIKSAGSYTGTPGKLRPSIHMPRWASRLTLIVEDVRVEPLQAISEADALAEGIDRLHFPERGDWRWPQRKYQDLWTSLHGPESWAANPDVLALTFRVVRGNIDRIAP